MLLCRTLLNFPASLCKWRKDDRTSGKAAHTEHDKPAVKRLSVPQLRDTSHTFIASFLAALLWNEILQTTDRDDQLLAASSRRCHLHQVRGLRDDDGLQHRSKKTEVADIMSSDSSEDWDGRWTGTALVVVICTGISISNALELLLLVVVTFKKRKGLYFWSLLVTSFSVLPYSIGYLIEYLRRCSPNETRFL